MKRRFFVRRAARYFLIMLVPTVLLYVILFSNSTDTSTRGFSILASGHSTQRSAATPRSIPVSQNEKSASYLVPFSFENSITGPVIGGKRAAPRRFLHFATGGCGLFQPLYAASQPLRVLR